MATACTESNTIRLLSSLCFDIVEAITSHVVEQYRAAMFYLATNNTMTDATETLYHVTEEAIQDTIGDSLLMCLAGWMQVWEKRSLYSDKLLELVAEEVTKRVNHSLAADIQSPSPQFDICRALLNDMVYHTAQILHGCFWRAKQIDLDGDFDFYSPDAEDLTPISSSLKNSVLPEFSGPDEVNNVECIAEAAKSDSDSAPPLFHVIEDSPSQAMEATKRASSFREEVQTFFGRRSAKVTPVSEVVQLEDGSALLPPEKKCHAINRMFSSLAKILRKPYTSCTSGGS
ncbi:uncharacterized protein LOC121887897 isoform X2 [Scomber scombrus]